MAHGLREIEGKPMLRSSTEHRQSSTRRWRSTTRYADRVPVFRFDWKLAGRGVRPNGVNWYHSAQESWRQWCATS